MTFTGRCKFSLGETESFEVWFLPRNWEHYSMYVAQECQSLEAAQAYCDAMKPLGTMEIVRVRTMRQLVAVVP
jgi:hypothetical protein